ncbi:MAG: phage tail protein [Spirochaetia bacterium]
MSFRVSVSHFKIEIEGLDCSEVNEIRGLDVFSIDSEKYQKNYNKTYTTELAIQRPFSDFGFFDWIDGNKRKDQPEKKKGVITFITPDGDPIVTFELDGIFPLEWHGPELRKADNWGHQAPLEQVLLAAEKVTRQE